MINRAKKKMSEGLPAIGAVLGMGVPEVAGAMARGGFDFLLVDVQHGKWNADRAHEAFRHIFESGSIPFVRVAENNAFAIGSMLDRGALGIVVPMVETVEEAEAAADAARYGPEGKRSVGGGHLRSFLGIGNEHINDEVFVAVQIETVRGVANAEDILKVDGIDGCWIGPSDLELSMGVDMQKEEDRHRHERAIQSVVDVCKKVGKVPGIATPGPNRMWLDAGCLFVTVTSDSSCVRLGAKTVAEKYDDIERRK